MVILDILINSKSKVVNFYNIFYIQELKHNLFSINIIEKADYLILAKKEKIIVFNYKNNIIFEIIKIGISYFVNIFASRRNLVLFSILLLKEFKLK